MKNKIGFHPIFALMAFTLGMALKREFDFESGIFKNTALGFLYLIVFAISIVLTFKKKKS